MSVIKTAPVLNDQPAEVDSLDFQSYSRALEKLLNHPETRTPLTLGIFGRWGTGKTTLMQMLRKSLKKVGMTTVWFDAWQYDKEDELWAAFLQSVLNRIDEQFSPLQRTVFHLRLLWARIDWRHVPGLTLLYLGRLIFVSVPILLAWPVSQQVGSLLAGTLSGVGENTAAAVSATMGQAVGQWLVKLAGLVASGALALWGLVKPLVAAIRQNLAVDFRPLLQMSDYEEHIAFLDRFKEHFEDVVRSLPLVAGKRLVIFIDDLDRCSTEKALQVLDAVKVFTDAEGCIFVLGLDHDLIQQAAKKKFQDDPRAQREYLDKIFQLPFQLPPLDPLKIPNYVAALDVDFPDERCLDILLRGVAENPRQIKRTINTFSLLYSLAAERQDEIGSISPLILTKLVVIQHNYPDLHRYLRRDPTRLKDLENFFRLNDASTLDGSLFILYEIMVAEVTESQLENLIFAFEKALEDWGLTHKIEDQSLNQQKETLIKAFDQHDQLGDLVDWAAQECPDLPWRGYLDWVKNARQQKSAYPTTRLPDELKPFTINAEFRQMFMLYSDTPEGSFQTPTPANLRAYYTFTRQAEPLAYSGEGAEPAPEPALG